MDRHKKSACPFKEDLNKNYSYNDYLNIEKLLHLQRPLSKYKDEFLFIMIHQIKELWIDLINRELFWIQKKIGLSHFVFNEIQVSFQRIIKILDQLISAWDVMRFLNLQQYLSFRKRLKNASGIQSYNFRILEFLLGNRNENEMAIYKQQPNIYQTLHNIINAPSIYDTIIHLLYKKKFDIDKKVLQRNFKHPYKKNPSVEKAWLLIYQNPTKYSNLFNLAELLVNLEEKIASWKHEHIKIAQRFIGQKKGTGETEGVNFLKKRTIDNIFFPELLSIRGQLDF